MAAADSRTGHFSCLHWPPYAARPQTIGQPLPAERWPLADAGDACALSSLPVYNLQTTPQVQVKQVRDCNDGWLDSTTVTSVACDADCEHEVRTPCHSMRPMRQRHDILSPCGASVRHAVAAKIANHNGATSGQHSNPQRDGTAAMDGSTAVASSSSLRCGLQIEQVRTPCNRIRTMCHSATP